MKVSILNLVPLRQGESYKAAMERMVNLAKKAEELGYTRYWIAEHHNTHSVASSATQLLIQYALSNTEKIRIGSGGVMLPNHSPYLVAEQYGTLETLYPGRVDLGLGRAPGTDLETARAIRRGVGRESDFEREVMELSEYFRDTEVVHAYPAAGLNIPLYILGSSTDSAYLAARLGLPYSFAAHFAPTMMETAIRIYQENFKPSDVQEKPYVILGANAILADTKEEAESLATTQWQAFLNIITNQSQGLLPPCAVYGRGLEGLCGGGKGSPLRPGGIYRGADSSGKENRGADGRLFFYRHQGRGAGENAGSAGESAF